MENQAIFLTEQREIKSLLLNVLENSGSDKEGPAFDSVFSNFPLQDESQLHKANEEISDRIKFEKLVTMFEKNICVQYFVIRLCIVKSYLFEL